MKLLPERSAAAPLLSLALLMRMAVELAVFFPNAANASWMCPLLGFVLFLPFMFALRQAEKLMQSSPWEGVRIALPGLLKTSIEVLFALLLMYDAALLVRLTASSYNVLALNHVTVHLLIFPLAAVIILVILMGINALGNSARMAMRFLLVLLLILLCVQLPEYRFSYLTPLLGPGYRNIIAGSISCAGNMALISLIWFLAQPGKNSRGLARYALFSALGTTALMLMLHAGYPSMPQMDFTRAARIELVLSNGRMSLAPQFLLNILWYSGLLYLISAEVCAASCWLKLALKKLALPAIAVVETGIISLAAIYNPWWLQKAQLMNMATYALVGAPFALTLLTVFIKRKGDISCA